MAASQEVLDWPKQDKRRMLHAVYRVGDMDKTIEYYTKHFGMKQLRYRDVPDERYTNAFLGFGPEDKNFALELTYNYGKDSYDIGSGFGHFALAVPDVYKTVESIKNAGGKVTRDAGPVKGGTSVIAFVEDPTGYKWELIQRQDQAIPEPIAQVMLRVTDLERSKKFYQEVLGCKLVKERDNPDYKYKLAFMAYGPEEDNLVFELTYNYGKDSIEDYGGKEAFLGKGYAQTAISTEDVYKTAEVVKARPELGGKIAREPGALPGLGTKITSILDPDGWKVVFVDNKDFLAEL
jgi:lactoylglutathione lyase